MRQKHNFGYCRAQKLQKLSRGFSKKNFEDKTLK